MGATREQIRSAFWMILWLSAVVFLGLWALGTAGH